MKAKDWTLHEYVNHYVNMLEGDSSAVWVNREELLLEILSQHSVPSFMFSVQAEMDRRYPPERKDQ